MLHTSEDLRTPCRIILCHLSHTLRVHVQRSIDRGNFYFHPKITYFQLFNYHQMNEDSELEPWLESQNRAIHYTKI